MWVRHKLAYPPLIILVLIGTPMLYGIHRAYGQSESSWLVAKPPSLHKIIDLPENIAPQNENFDCTKEALRLSDQTDAHDVCIFQSPIGAVTKDGQLMTSPSKVTALQGFENTSFLLPLPSSSMAIVSVSTSSVGSYLGVYKDLTKADLRHYSSSASDYYQITRQPDSFVSDPITNEPLRIDTEGLAFSENGDWLVADLPYRGLVRVHLTDLSVTLFASPIEPSWYLGLARPALAVSNDGRYVAANTDLFGGGNLNVYDITTCDDQLHAPEGRQEYCKGRDILLGRNLIEQNDGNGLLQRQNGLWRPLNIRFVNNDNISFDAQYHVTSPTQFRAGSFVATVTGSQWHGVGLLGLGDSYISGEGTFNYRSATDTTTNSCHLSEVAYPFLLPTSPDGLHRSVACSGARMTDIIGRKNYDGQARDETRLSESDEQKVITTFLPGYIPQRSFVATYAPATMLLSVGGNDIGFSDILKTCVANPDGGTCYDTYEDRAELINEIDAQYTKLVATYKKLRQQAAGGRLYVVGYPQIASKQGSCGLNVRLNERELLFSSQLITYLDDVTRQATATAGAVFVDTQHAFDGHKLCEPGEKAVNGLTAGTDSGVTVAGHEINFVAAESYHPTELGHRLLAQIINDKTAGLQMDMPTPTAFHAPQFDTTTDMLLDVPKTGRIIRWATNDDSLTADMSLAGSNQQVTVDGNSVQLQPGNKYQIVLHSDPVLLAEGITDAVGNISTAIRIPAATPPGYHVLHLLTQNMAGDPIDIWKTIYVADHTASSSAGSGSSNGSKTDWGQDIPMTTKAQGTIISVIDHTYSDKPISVAALQNTAGVAYVTSALKSASDNTPSTADDKHVDPSEYKSFTKYYYLHWRTWLEIISILSALTVFIRQLSAWFGQKRIPDIP